MVLHLVGSLGFGFPPSRRALAFALPRPCFLPAATVAQHIVGSHTRGAERIVRRAFAVFCVCRAARRDRDAEFARWLSDLLASAPRPAVLVEWGPWSALPSFAVQLSFAGPCSIGRSKAKKMTWASFAQHCWGPVADIFFLLHTFPVARASSKDSAGPSKLLSPGEGAHKIAAKASETAALSRPAARLQARRAPWPEQASAKGLQHRNSNGRRLRRQTRPNGGSRRHEAQDMWPLCGAGFQRR